MIEVVNRQRHFKVDTEAWTTFATKALTAIAKGESSATIAFVSDKRIRELNRQFRGVDKATDVLSFPAEEESNLGDVAISVEIAVAQAEENDRVGILALDVQVLFADGGEVFDGHSSYILVGQPLGGKCSIGLCLEHVTVVNFEVSTYRKLLS